MTDPSKERIAAALALAEALHQNTQGLEAALDAYRATLPVLRTRAEVDAEIAKCAHSGVMGYQSWDMVHENMRRLCAEPTAEEP